MKINLAALLCGILFGIGLSLSQMVNPEKVINFLDITGHWDPSLLFVMAGALPVTLLAYRRILKRQAPLLESNFQIPQKLSVDTGLVLGAALFGIGWGITGYCPGPAVSGLGIFSFESVLVILSILSGFAAYHHLFESK
ncbi:MAG: DUF6691 family protein [Gammaproteobacteria bacterium]